MELIEYNHLQSLIGLIIFGLRNGNIHIISYDLMSATFFKRFKVFDVAFCILVCEFQSDYKYRYFVNGGHQACFMAFLVYGPQIHRIEHTLYVVLMYDEI